MSLEMSEIELCAMYHMPKECICGEHETIEDEHEHHDYYEDRCDLCHKKYFGERIE